MVKRFLGKSKDGKDVFLRTDIPEFLANMHIFCNEKILMEAISKLEIGNQESFCHQIPFDGIIGSDPCIPVFDKNEVVMVKRGNNSWETPMVLSGHVEATNILSIEISFSEDINAYVVKRAALGKLPPFEPEDPRCEDIEESKRFWSCHGIVPTDSELMEMEMNGIC